MIPIIKKKASPAGAIVPLLFTHDIEYRNRVLERA